MSELRGILIARGMKEAQIGLDRMAGQLGAPSPSLRDWLLVTLNNYRTDGLRGHRVPNRVLVIDLKPEELPVQLWQTIIPMLDWRQENEAIVASYFTSRREFDNLGVIDTHVFTVRRQDGIGPHPPNLPCARPGCGLRADQHKTVRIAQG